MLGLLAMSVVLLLLATRTRHQRMFTLAFLPMLIFTPMAYELSSQEEALAFFTAFVGVISPLVIIEILVWHYRKRAAQTQLAASETSTFDSEVLANQSLTFVARR
jgi:hypothetical protein